MLCGDGVGCAGCLKAHLRGQNDKFVIMCGGRTTISWRLKEKKKPRLLVGLEDQLPPKAAPKSLRTRAYSRCQQIIDRIQPDLLLASETFCRWASLLLLHRPATPATSAGRIGVAIVTIRWQPEYAPTAWRWHGNKGQPLAILGTSARFRHVSRVTAEFRAFLSQPLKHLIVHAPLGKSPM